MATDPTTRPRPPQTLIERLTPGIARIRGSAHAMAGDHALRLFLTTVAWDGGEEGRGKPVMTRREFGCGPDRFGKIVPPKITLAGQYSRLIQGVVDEGTAIVEELDPTYMETEFANFGRLGRGEESYYEIVQDARDGGPPDRPVGRYELSGRPRLGDVAASWTLILHAQELSPVFGGAQLTDDGGPS